MNQGYPHKGFFHVDARLYHLTDRGHSLSVFRGVLTARYRLFLFTGALTVLYRLLSLPGTSTALYRILGFRGTSTVLYLILSLPGTSTALYRILGFRGTSTVLYLILSLPGTSTALYRLLSLRRTVTAAIRPDRILFYLYSRIRAPDEECLILKHCPQHVMLVNQCVPCLLKAVSPGAFPELKQPCLVVMAGTGQLHILEKCHDGTVRNRTFIRFLADCGSTGAFDAGSNSPDRFLLHDVCHGYPKTHFPKKAYQTYGTDGISSKSKEAV